MTRQKVTFWVYATISVYILCIIIGISLKYHYPETNNPIYTTFKDLIAFLIAIPAAWLGYCFSRRISYLQHLQSLWTHVNSSIQQVIQYTHLPNPEPDDYANVQLVICTMIDEIRGVFKNLGENRTDGGLYPFEELKKIQKIHSSLGFGDTFTEEIATDSRKKIILNWKNVRVPFLSEFDREEPTFPSSPFL